MVEETNASPSKRLEGDARGDKRRGSGRDSYHCIEDNPHFILVNFLFPPTSSFTNQSTHLENLFPPRA